MDRDKMEDRGAPNPRQAEVDRARDAAAARKPNPPRTVTGKFAAPKFGSAGSGGAELEPGPERD